MFKKIISALLIAFVLSFVIGSTVYAAGPQNAGTAKAKARNPDNRVRAQGIVSAVDAAAGTFSITGKEGQVWSFSVIEKTQYRGEIASLADLKVGMQAGAGGRKNESKLVALVVIARSAPERIAGKVTAVNLAANSFTLTGKDGKLTTILINAETRFNSPDGSIKSLADLKPDMLAGARVFKQADGSLLAKVVLAGKVQAEVRMAGRVSAVNAQSFIFVNRKGETVTVAVNAETQFKGINGKSVSLADLKPEMRVGVAADKLDDGTYLAKLVIFKADK